MAQSISPQQRALNFGAYTRQHIQTLGSQKGGSNSHIEFEVPKARLLQGINLLCEVELATSTASNWKATTLNEKMELYNILRRVSIDYNNGFSPVVASGKDIAVANMLRMNPKIVHPSGVEGASLCTITAPRVTTDTEDAFTAESATAMKYYFMLELPLTLNERDPSGLVLAQNGQTLINFSCDIADTVKLSTPATITVSNVNIIPVLGTFSIPTAPEAFPDLSVLKILDSRTETFTGGGSNVVKLPVGMIYRKLILKFEKTDGTPMTADEITSNIELVFNTADIPYSVHPKALRLRTTSQIGGKLPEGYYAFDFTYQGMPNYGGSRDYVDTERLTTFELRFTTADSGKVTIISEKISRLISSNN